MAPPNPEKVCLVSGASSGIGEYIARHFAEIGYKKLVIVARRTNLLEEVASKCRAHGAEVLVLTLDLGKAENNEVMIEETIKKFGRLDIVINNAARTCEPRPVEQQHLEDFRSILDINLLAPFVATKSALPHLRKVKGTIVNVCSIYGTSPQIGCVAYNSSKAALKMLTKITALEEAPNGVRVNILSPGFINTEMFSIAESEFFTRDDIARVLASRAPLGRVGEPIEMAKVCAFLVDDDNSFMTGTDCFTDGGFMLTSQLPTK